MPLAEKKSITAIAAVVASLSGAVHAAGIEWPSDFWQQVTNRIEAVASEPVESGETEGFVSSGVDEYALEFVLGTEEIPFDSRLFTEKRSDPLSVNSFPCNFTVTIR